MPTVEIDKDGGYIVVATDGIVNRRSIKLADTVVSVPPEGMKKIKNIYFDSNTGKVVITYDPES